MAELLLIGIPGYFLGARVIGLVMTQLGIKQVMANSIGTTTATCFLYEVYVKGKDIAVSSIYEACSKYLDKTAHSSLPSLKNIEKPDENARLFNRLQELENKLQTINMKLNTLGLTSEEEITQKATIQNLAEHNRNELRDNSTAAGSISGTRSWFK
ncbi:MAG: hypothetical protein MRQ09_00965 [Candidatus Midichloria sp.]|nr:hypothetical protein [Candidatus Midichloria sp.]